MEKKPYYEEDFLSSVFSEKNRPVSIYLYFIPHICCGLIGITEGVRSNNRLSPAGILRDIVFGLVLLVSAFWVIRRERKRDRIRKELNVVVKETEPKQKRIEEEKFTVYHAFPDVPEKRIKFILYIILSLFTISASICFYTDNDWDNEILGLIIMALLVTYNYKIDKKKKAFEAQLSEN